MSKISGRAERGMDQKPKGRGKTGRQRRPEGRDEQMEGKTPAATKRISYFEISSRIASIEG
jgi:hypothetical protein